MPIDYGKWSTSQKSKEITELTKRSKVKRPKGRSAKIYQNKINHLKKKYRKLFNSSKKRKTAFYLDYPTVNEYMKNFEIKKPNINV